MFLRRQRKVGRSNVPVNVEDGTERGWLRSCDSGKRLWRRSHFQGRSSAPLACCVVGSRILLRLNINSMLSFSHQNATPAVRKSDLHFLKVLKCLKKLDWNPTLANLHHRCENSLNYPRSSTLTNWPAVAKRCGSSALDSCTAFARRGRIS